MLTRAFEHIEVVELEDGTNDSTQPRLVVNDANFKHILVTSQNQPF